LRLGLEISKNLWSWDVNPMVRVWPYNSRGRVEIISKSAVKLSLVSLYYIMIFHFPIILERKKKSESLIVL
jgi:hypothetical protein